MPDLTIVHLYPDLLRTYGDRGNILALKRRAEWRGIDTEVVSVTRGEQLPSRCQIVFLGGGSDRIQQAIGPDLLPRGRQLSDLTDSGTVVVGVCGGYQMLGRHYRAVDGSVIEGLGLMDARTEAGDKRIIGRIRACVRRDGLATSLIGFENHAGRTWLGPGAEPLARVENGGGNNGTDGTEGAVHGRIIGTYLHGPVLPLNPALADWVLRLALGRDELAPLGDDPERLARSAWPKPKRRAR